MRRINKVHKYSRSGIALLFCAVVALLFAACSLGGDIRVEQKPFVTFNANGGSGTPPAAQMANSGSAIKLPGGNGLSRDGYAFSGWSASASGTGPNYDAGYSYIVTASITLYAKWTHVYTVTFSANGATFGAAPAAQTANAGSAITLPGGNGLSRDGYAFSGWSASASGTGTNYAVGSSYTVIDDVTLYAQWNAVSTGPVSIDMVRVPGGSFQMGKELGTGGYSDVTPVHAVTLTGFYMGKYEVTQGQYREVMGSNPAGGYGVGDNYPVYYVSWYDAVAFCNALSEREGLAKAYTISGSTVTANWSANGYRLPTEAEWEYAAKGGNGSPGNYAYAGSNNVGDVAWYSGNSSSRTHEVGTKAPNGLGLYDMSGNVWEWCWDWYGSYSSEAQIDPAGASSGSDRV